MVTDPGLTANQERFHSGRVEGYTPVATPVKQFRGFERVALDLGQKTVTFTLGTGDLQLLDRDTHWLAVPGTFDIMIGKSLADIAMKGALEVKVSGGLAGFE